MKAEYAGNPQHKPQMEQIHGLVNSILKSNNGLQNFHLQNALNEIHGRPTVKNDKGEIADILRINQYYNAVKNLMNNYNLLTPTSIKDDKYHISSTGSKVIKAGSIQKYIDQLDNPSLSWFQKLTIIHWILLPIISFPGMFLQSIIQNYLFQIFTTFLLQA